MEPLTVALVGATAVSALGSYSAEKKAMEANRISSEFKAQSLEMSAELATFQAKMNNLSLTKRYNDTQATNAVMAAAQGRTSGGSVAAIAKQDIENLEWDKKFMELSGQFASQGYIKDAAETRAAGIRGSQIASQSAKVGLLSSAVQIGGLIS